MSHVRVETVHLSSAGLSLVILDHTRQREYARVAAEQFKLERLLEQVAAQKVVLDSAKRAYQKTVAEMDAVANRNQFNCK